MSAGFISDRWFRGRRKLLVVGCQIVGGVCLWLFTRVDSVVTYMVLQSVAGFLLFMACGAIWTLPMVLLPPRLMGSGSGLINAGGQIGGFVTNLMIGYYVGFRGGDYGAGFEVMLAALVLATGLVGFGIVEKRAPALAPAAVAAG
jgi:sugar phosphate permease